MKFRLQSRHTLTLLAVLAIALAVLSGTLLYEFRALTKEMQKASSDAIETALKEEAKEAGIALGNFLATAMRTPVYQLDFASIGRLTESALAQNSVTYVYAFDSEGRVIHDGTLALQDYGHQLDDPVVRVALNAAQTSAVFDSELLHVTVPVVIGEKVHGGVRIGLSTNDIQKAIALAAKRQTSIGESGFAQILAAALSVTMLLGIIGVIVSMKLAQNLTQPIKVLSDLAHRIGGGEYDIKVPINRRDELGDLALSFKEMAEELSRAAHRNALLATFVEHVGDAIEVINTDAEIEYTNPAHERITGYTLAEALGRTPAALHRPEGYDPAFYDRIWKTAESGQVWKGTILGRRKDGSLWHQDTTISPVRSEKGKITHYIAIKRDITADIERRHALAESEQRFRDFAEAASDWLWEMDENLRFASFTGNEPHVGGRVAAEAYGKTRWELFGADPDTDENWGRHRDDLEARRPFRDFRFEFDNADGKTIYLSASGKPVYDEDGRFTGYRGTACNMSAEVESEKARRESEELLASIVSNLPGRVYRRILHRDGNFSYPYFAAGDAVPPYFAAGDAVPPTFSWDRKAPSSPEITMHVHPDDKLMWHDMLRQSAETLEPYDFEFRRLQPSGESNWVRVIGRPHRLANGDTVWDSISLDVSDRKQAELALQASEIRFRRLVENATDAFFLHDLDGHFTDANQHAAESLDYTLDELLSLNVGDIEVGHNHKSLSEIWERLKSGEALAVSGQHRRRDGSTFPVDVRISGIEVDGRPHILALARDTTERDLVQRQLAHTSKMATLGEMGAGIAHELNQPLQIIRIAADHCMAMLDGGAADLRKLRGRLNKISSQTGRMSQIINHMRVLSRRDDVPPELLNPAACATAAITYSSSEFRQSKIQISTNFHKDASFIVGHSVQIEQAILNLLTNAKDAIHSARNDGKDSGHIEVTVKDDKASGRVKIIVADDGGGVPEAIVERIFDPFFTTKEVGVGTGLGLSVSYGFVNAMGGSIDVRNTKKGAEFVISLAAMESSGSRLDEDLSAAE
jgi:PAS domain S-box-containing protein